MTKRIEALCKLSLVVEENVIQNLSSFSLFFGDMKTIAYESSLDLYFNFFDLSSYSSVLRIAGERAGGEGRKKLWQKLQLTVDSH